MSKHELNRIASSIIEEVEDYQATLEEKRFAPFIGKRVTFKMVDRSSTPDRKATFRDVEGTVSQIWMNSEDNNLVYLRVVHRSPNSGHMTWTELHVGAVTFL
jgi:hypothetical protein